MLKKPVFVLVPGFHGPTSRSGPVLKTMLIKATVIAIPEYTMQCYRMPVRICDEVDKLVRNFLWGSTVERKKMHMVGWSQVTMPQDLGGLGIFQMKARNAALLAKLCWKIASSQNYPWAQMLISKYLIATRLSEGGRKLPASKIWAACKEGGIIFNKGLKWVVANGEEVGLWDDFWLPSGPLRKQIEGPLAEGENNMSVKMFLSNPNGVSFNFLETIMNDIQGIPLASCTNLKDRLISAYSKDGSFSLKFAYLLAKGLNPLNLASHPCRWVWDAYTTLMIIIIIYLFFCVASILEWYSYTCSAWFKGFQLMLTYEVCGNSDESIIHALRDCPGAKRVWVELGIQCTNQEFYNLPLLEWLKSNYCSVQIFSWPLIPWKMLFP